MRRRGANEILAGWRTGRSPRPARGSATGLATYFSGSRTSSLGAGVPVRGLLHSCLVAASGLLLAACAEPDPIAESAAHVEAGPPVVADVDLKLRYPIELEADEEVAITPVAISGFLRKVVVDVGDEVKGGQLIALVDCREYAAQRVQAETAIAKSEAQVDESASQLERLTRMGERLVAPSEIEKARADARVAAAELADARAKLSEAGQRQGYCSLRSPFSGFVSNRYLDAGAMVAPGGMPVVSIVKTKEVRVVASVTEQDAPSVMRGAAVELEFHAFPDAVFRAEVVRTGRSLDEKTRTLRVEMELPNTTEALLPGMTGHAWIVIGKREAALLVPSTAVLRLEESAFAYVVREKDKPRAQRVEVELGVDHGDWVEVRKGIEKTDTVIMTGRELVDDGSWVEMSAPSQTFEAPDPGEDGDATEEAPKPREDGDAAAADIAEPQVDAAPSASATDGAGPSNTSGGPTEGKATGERAKAKPAADEAGKKKRAKREKKEADPAGSSSSPGGGKASPPEGPT